MTGLSETKRYQAYPAYKDSGVEWSDTLPLSWGTVNLRWISTIYAGGTPSKTNQSFWENGTVPWINSGAVNQGLVTKPSTLITEQAYQNSSAKWIPKGSLVVALAGQGKTKGMVAQLAIDSTCNQSMGAIVPEYSEHSRYLYWWLTSNYQNIRNMAGGDLRDGLNLEHLGSIQCPQPSVDECVSIANFLDHETAKIDTLIEKQQQLIKLLKEKRQAVISNAVTKGLNPQTPMKDSGVEWLGDVPEHWKVAALKYFVSAPIIDGPHVSPTRCDTGIPFISAEAISNGRINFDKKWGYISEAAHAQYSKRYCPQKNDLLIVKLGATTGAIAIVETDEPFNIWVPLATVRTVADLDSKFVYYLFQSSQIADAIQQSWTFGTQQTLGLGTLSNLRIPVPPTDESKKIVLEIESKVVQFDDVINKSSESLDLLKERRTALISAAVTGKIDVRNWQAPIEQQEQSVEQTA